MDLIKEIVIPNPPTKYVQEIKKAKFDKDGKAITQNTWYLTANLFTNTNVSFHITSKIVYDVKIWLYEHLKGLPKLEKMRVEFEYHKPTHIDLDNVCFFWKKQVMDILKTPTVKQIEKSKKYKRAIITTNTIYDDNTKYVSGYKEDFFIGEHKMIIRIYGRIASEQQSIGLFNF